MSKTASGKIVRLLIHYGFIVALLLILSGFGFAAWNAYLKTKRIQQKTGNATTNGPQSPAVTGDENQFNYDHSSRPEQKPKPPK